MERHGKKTGMHCTLGIIFLMGMLCGMSAWQLARRHTLLQQRRADDVLTSYIQAIQTHNPRLLDSVLHDTSSQGYTRATQRIHRYDGVDIQSVVATAHPTESAYAIGYELEIIGIYNQQDVRMQDTIMLQKLPYWDHYPMLDTLFYYTWFLIL